MRKVDVEGVLRGALVRHSRLSAASIGPDAPLDGSRGLDSFALLNALVDVEDELGVEVEPERLADVRGMRFSELVDLVASLEPPPDPTGGPAAPGPAARRDGTSP